jgi:hypothetical protein
LNDQGRPYLYSPDLFTLVDAREPADWVNEVGEDGERYAYPPQIQFVGFFEDFFDDQREILARVVQTDLMLNGLRLAGQQSAEPPISAFIGNYCHIMGGGVDMLLQPQFSPQLQTLFNLRPGCAIMAFWVALIGSELAAGRESAVSKLGGER